MRKIFDYSTQNYCMHMRTYHGLESKFLNTFPSPVTYFNLHKCVKFKT